MESPLASYRKEHGLTQAALAAVLGVKPPAICKWEKGRIPSHRVIDIQKVTGIARHQLRPDLYPEEAAA